jgi:ubiquinone/menaquinone biosynthesis C-methylase UbiE
MVKRARAKVEISTIPMGIVANVTSGLPFREDVFGLVFSLRLFHHLHQAEERRAALAEFARVSTGWLILSFYQTNLLHQTQRVLRRLVKRSKTRIRMISRPEFQEEAEGTGFRLVKVYPLFRGIHAQRIALLRKANLDLL